MCGMINFHIFSLYYNYKLHRLLNESKNNKVQLNQDKKITKLIILRNKVKILFSTKDSLLCLVDINIRGREKNSKLYSRSQTN